MVNDKKYDERDQIGERKSNQKYLEESETGEINQIEITTTFNRINTQE